MSPPAVNVSPAPARTTKRTASSRSSSSKTPRSSSRAFIETRLNLPGTSSVIVATPRVGVALDPEPVVLAHSSSRSMRRRIFPDGLFGSSDTKRYSRGRLKRASDSDARQKASRSSAVTPVVGDDAGDHALAEALVDSADDGDLAHARRPGEDVLHLDGMDVLAAGDDHVVHTPDDPEVAVLVEPPDVACVVPAVADRLLVGVGPVPVAGERLVRGHVAEDLAFALAGSSRRRALRAARPAQPGFARWRALDGERVDLGRAVVVHEDLRLERARDLLHERARHRRARIRDRADGRDVGAREVLVVHQVVVERWREVERVDPLRRDELERPCGRPRRLGDVAASDDRRRKQGVDAHRVVERHDAERPMARVEAVLQRLREPAGTFGAVRAGNALRPSGRPRRVELDRRRPLVEIEGARVLRLRRELGDLGRARGGRPRRPRRRCSTRDRPPRSGARAARRRHRATGSPSRARPFRARSGARTRRGRHGARRVRSGLRRCGPHERGAPRT